MGYSNFRKISQVTNKFGLQHQMGVVFPAKIKGVRPSAWLKKSLELGYEMPLTNEKSKAERLVSPVLSEVAHAFRAHISLFSGEDISVRPEDDLAGPCDFFFAYHPPKLALEAPVISLAEAKDEDMDWGIGQCAAQMYGAYLFNQERNKPINTIFGCATTGVEWQFLKFEDNTFTVEQRPFTELSQILGAWHQLLNTFFPVTK
jgi:hypothetical protein